jgi:hypothetical protein
MEWRLEEGARRVQFFKWLLLAALQVSRERKKATTALGE